jgi:hypothetical protein
MAVLGLALLYGGRACLRVTSEIYQDDLGQNQQTSSHPAGDLDDTRLPFLLGVCLICLGTPFVIGAILPARVLYNLPFLSNPSAGRETVEQFLQ